MIAALDRHYFARVKGATLVIRRTVTLAQGGARVWRVAPFGAWFAGADFVPTTPARVRR